MDSFILLWLGEKYVLSNTILLLMIGNFFMIQISTPIERFKNAYGLYSDTWAAAAEAIINLGISLALGRIYGIAGIMTGTLVSMFLIVVLWKPYFLYKNGFNKSVFLYWKGLLPIIFVFCTSAFLVNYISRFITYDTENLNIFSWAIYAFQITLTVTLIYGTLLFLFISGFKVFCIRIKRLLLNKISK